MKKLTTEEFVQNAIKVHGNKYDYSLVEYINNYTKIKIICPIHGVFEQLPFNHVNLNHGCHQCTGHVKLTTTEFIKKSHIIYGDRYDNSLIEYINDKTKVKIICPIHGIFEQTPRMYLTGKGCLKCEKDKLKKPKEYYIEKFNKIHNNNYDYSLLEYVNSFTKIKIICKIHGIFEQTPSDHLHGSGCKLCVFDKRKLTISDIIEKSNYIHKNKYDYSLLVYDNYKSKVKIICPIHGEFEQRIMCHLDGQGCPLCGNVTKRIKHIKRIQKNKLNGHQLFPNFNRNACKMFDEISLNEGIHIQHAMNGGECYIKELGYWLDGYDSINNVVYEFDERHHKYQKEKDLIRQKEIENYLKCKFIRIKE